MQVVAVNSQSLTAAAYIKPQRKIKEVKIMNAYIDYSISKGCRVFMSKQAMENLSRYEPKGCPFKDYTLLDLVKDLMAFSWRITESMSLADYIRLLQAENYIHAVAYGDAIIKCLEA